MGPRSDAPLYLDTNATTPLDPHVAEAMQPYLREHFGNPSSGHAYGRTARAAVDRARGQVAGLLGCAPGEVVFTSGGSGPTTGPSRARPGLGNRAGGTW